MVHIIAEAGNNHNGSVKQAFKLVDLAKTCGADSIKFQVIEPSGLYLPQFFDNGIYQDNEIYKKRFSSVLSDEDYRRIAEYCQSKKISFSASVFDTHGIQLLKKLNADYIKVASCDLNNHKLLLQASEAGKKLLISTGMATLAEIDNAVSVLVKSGFEDIVLMHCISSYPAATEKTNMCFIKTLKEAFGFPVGFSDHTENSISSAIAIAYGVSWLEKHFTFDKLAEGFDHSYAMDPDGFREFIQDIRSAEKACIKKTGKLQEEEYEVKKRARRGLYAARDIDHNEIIKEEDVLVVRPETCLQPNDLELIAGKKATHKIKKYQPLTMEMFYGY